MHPEAGCDEAGRGCLAGPVVAAAVILDDISIIPGLNDSKKMSAVNRERLRPEIEAKALAWSVAFVDAETIDSINILKASIKAMHIALDGLEVKPAFVIVDGNRFISWNKIPFECIVKGDSKFMSIAAASIIAKTYRDDYMEKIHKEYPYYNWNKNKGYPTIEHKMAILKHGFSPYHRKTFSCSIQTKLF